MAMFDLQLDYSLLKIKSIDRSRHKQKMTIAKIHYLENKVDFANAQGMVLQTINAKSY